MSGSSPIWLTFLIATLTGLFALAGQALGGFQTRKSQAQLFEAQRQASRGDEARRRLEELYSCFTIMFDQTHDAVTSYRRYRRGLLPLQLARKSIGQNDNDNYKRIKVLLSLYYPDLGKKIGDCLEPALLCQDWLVSWKADTSKEMPDDFDKNWAQAMKLERQVTKRMADIASKFG